MKTRRILSMLLALVMVLSLVPTFTFAAEGDTEGKLFLDKTTTLNDRGGYDINISAYTTGNVTTTTIEKGVPLDIVLVVDQSGSMAWGMSGEKSKITENNPTRLEALKTAVSGFVTAVYENGKANKVDHRIAMVGFASNKTDEDAIFSSNPYNNTGIFNENGKFVKYNKNPNYKAALVPVANENGTMRPSLNTAIQNFQAEGATRASLGVEMANHIFEANPLGENLENRERIMIVFTDGEPGQSEYSDGEAMAAITNASISKTTHHATVYTIGLFSSPGKVVTNFMNILSSNSTVFSPVSPSKFQDGSYYVLDDGQYYLLRKGTFIFQTIYYYNKDGYSIEIDPKWSGNNRGTQLYEPTFSGNYYKTASNADELNNIFKTISEESTSTSSPVELTANSMLRDFLAKDFQFEPHTTEIYVYVVPGEVKNGEIEWGESIECGNISPQKTDGVTSSAVTRDKIGRIETTLTWNEPDTDFLHIVDVTGFDYQKHYIAEGHPGYKLEVQINDVHAAHYAATDRSVYTNDDQSGIWALNESGKNELKVPFSQKPTSYIPSKSYVMDYAKPLTFAPSDFRMDTAKTIRNDYYKSTEEILTDIDHKYGNLTLADNALTYTPKTMQWDGFDTFFVFGTTTDETVRAASANANGNVWGKVNVIPANNVYYEDTFISSESNGTVGITYTGVWDEIKEDTAGQNPGAAEGAEDNQGWIPVLNGETGDTDGSSHHANVADNQTATATFTFTGTGVDVYSRTNSNTGTIMATLVQITDESRKNVEGVLVDTQSLSSGDGDYFQIPTLSFHGKNNQPLPYGTYEVTIDVTNFAANRMDYYLDGIRVYNPIAEDETVQGAYGPDELNATFLEVRDLLLDSKDTAETKVGPVFIDQLENGATGQVVTEIATYQDYGPKNEVYLKKDATHSEMLSFKVIPGNKYFIGMKSVTGNPVTVQIGTDADKKEITVNHTADMYYEVTPDSNGFIHIQNSSENVLAITKLKVTNPEAAVDTAQVFAATTEPEILASAQAFSMAPVTPDSSESTEPDVDIENPEEKPENPGIWDILDKIFGGIGGWFRP